MTLPVAPSDWVALARDPHPAVRDAAHAMLSRVLEQADPVRVGGALWELAGTDGYEALPWVVPRLAHPNAEVGRLALLALKSLHPLCGLPRRSGAVVPSAGEPSQMNEWLRPRPLFDAALRALLRTPQRERAIARLARLPGEAELIDRAVVEETDPATSERFRSLQAEQRGRRTPVQLIIALTYRCNRKCPYCYAYESQDALRHDIDYAQALYSLDWAVRQEARLVSFTGGEPTCHPRFADLVREVENRGLKLYLNTNGLFDSPLRDALSSRCMLNVGFHVSERKLHRAGELERIRENAAALLERGVDVFLRHTLWRGSHDDCDWLLEWAAELGIRHVNLALGFPGKTATNRFIPVDELAGVRPIYLHALDKAAEVGIRVRSSKPVPLCLFTPAEYARLQRYHEMSSVCTVHERDGVHNIVVNPDLRTYPCVGLPFPGPSLSEHTDYAAHATHARHHIARALRVVQTGCDACALLPLGVCQGSCLGHCNAGPASAPTRMELAR